MRWTSWKVLIPLLLATGGFTLWFSRVRSEHRIEPLWEELAGSDQQDRRVFASAMVAELPPPARRYLLRAIAPGTPLAQSVTLRMHGSMRLQPEADLLPMQADQVLAPPEGLIWRARVGSGLMRFQGFDSFARGKGRLRWWVQGLLPVVNESGADVDRSAAGRVAGEAILLPSTLLPGRGVRWEAISETQARYTMQVGDERVPVTISVDAEGRLERVHIHRWHEDAGNGAAGYDAFVVDDFAHERSFDGYTIPTSFRAGWRLGEADGFPFFYATLENATFR